MRRIALLAVALCMVVVSQACAVTVTVPGSWTYEGFWADTGLNVSAGASIHVTATGVLTASAWGDTTCGPDGYADIEWRDQWLNPNSLGDGNLDPAAGGAAPIVNHYYALIGYIGPGPLTPSLYGNVDYATKVSLVGRMMLLGSDVIVTAPASGRLWLGINTDAYAGNLTNDQGSLTASVNVVPEPCSALVLVTALLCMRPRRRRM